METQPDQTNHCSVTNAQPPNEAALAELGEVATLQARLAQATLLLAETRHHCQALLEAALVNADDMVANGRAIAERIIAEARAETTHVDVRERSSSMFGDLWSELGEHHDPDVFFDGFHDRQAEEIFER